MLLGVLFDVSKRRWAQSVKCPLYERVGCHFRSASMNSYVVTVGLTEKTSKRANLDFTMHWNHTAPGIALHDYMASALAYLLKPKPLESALNLGA